MAIPMRQRADDPESDDSTGPHDPLGEPTNGQSRLQTVVMTTISLAIMLVPVIASLISGTADGIAIGDRIWGDSKSTSTPAPEPPPSNRTPAPIPQPTTPCDRYEVTAREMSIRDEAGRPTGQEVTGGQQLTIWDRRSESGPPNIWLATTDDDVTGWVDYHYLRPVCPSD
jgi:hypothetical protein